MELLDLRNPSSQAKCLGTIVAISGAMVVTLYKGPPLITQAPSDASNKLLSLLSNWTIGGLLLAITSLLSSIGNILQVNIALSFHLCQFRDSRFFTPLYPGFWWCLVLHSASNHSIYMILLQGTDFCNFSPDVLDSYRKGMRRWIDSSLLLQLIWDHTICCCFHLSGKWPK